MSKSSEKLTNQDLYEGLKVSLYGLVADCQKDNAVSSQEKINHINGYVKYISLFLIDNQDDLEEDLLNDLSRITEFIPGINKIKNPLLACLILRDLEKWRMSGFEDSIEDGSDYFNRAIAILLEDLKLDPNYAGISDDGNLMSPLVASIVMGCDLSVVECLFENGAEVHGDFDGESEVQLALRQSRTDVLFLMNLYGRESCSEADLQILKDYKNPPKDLVKITKLSQVSQAKYQAELDEIAAVKEKEILEQQIKYEQEIQVRLTNIVSLVNKELSAEESKTQLITVDLASGSPEVIMKGLSPDALDLIHKVFQKLSFKTSKHGDELRLVAHNIKSSNFLEQENEQYIKDFQKQMAVYQEEKARKVRFEERKQVDEQELRERNEALREVEKRILLEKQELHDLKEKIALATEELSGLKTISNKDPKRAARREIEREDKTKKLAELNRELEEKDSDHKRTVKEEGLAKFVNECAANFKKKIREHQEASSKILNKMNDCEEIQDLEALQIRLETLRQKIIEDQESNLKKEVDCKKKISKINHEESKSNSDELEKGQDELVKLNTYLKVYISQIIPALGKHSETLVLLEDELQSKIDLKRVEIELEKANQEKRQKQLEAKEKKLKDQKEDEEKAKGKEKVRKTFVPPVNQPSFDFPRRVDSSPSSSSSSIGKTPNKKQEALDNLLDIENLGITNLKGSSLNLLKFLVHRFYLELADQKMVSHLKAIELLIGKQPELASLIEEELERANINEKQTALQEAFDQASRGYLGSKFAALEYENINHLDSILRGAKSYRDDRNAAYEAVSFFLGDENPADPHKGIAHASGNEEKNLLKILFIKEYFAKNEINIEDLKEFLLRKKSPIDLSDLTITELEEPKSSIEKAKVNRVKSEDNTK